MESRQRPDRLKPSARDLTRLSFKQGDNTQLVWIWRRMCFKRMGQMPLAQCSWQANIDRKQTHHDISPNNEQRKNGSPHGILQWFPGQWTH